MKRGGPQGSAANATVLIPPLGDAQPGGGGGTQENTTRDRGQGRDEEGASRQNCGEWWWWWCGYGVDVVTAAILGRSGSEAEAPETSTGILPVQCHGQALAEHDRTGVRGLELAGSQSRRFGKL